MPKSPPPHAASACAMSSEPCSTRRSDELAAICSMYGNDAVESADGVTVTLKQDHAYGQVAISVVFTLPLGYPEMQSPSFHITSNTPIVTRHMISTLQSLGDDFLRSTFAGDECLFPMLCCLQEHLSTLISSESPHVASHAVVSVPVHELAVVKLDHMRKPSLYVKTLARITAATACRCKCIVPPEYADDVLIKHVWLLVLGDVPAFTAALRTDYVDVDSHGKRCCEKQSSLHWRRTISTAQHDRVLTMPIWTRSDTVFEVITATDRDADTWLSKTWCDEAL